jgi:hypothetical protein
METGRLWLVLSPDVARGFSGEARSLPIPPLPSGKEGSTPSEPSSSGRPRSIASRLDSCVS